MSMRMKREAWQFFLGLSPFILALVLIFLVRLLCGCSYDMYHHRDGTPKHPLATDKEDPVRPVEMPKPKGTP